MLFCEVLLANKIYNHWFKYKYLEWNKDVLQLQLMCKRETSTVKVKKSQPWSTTFQ